MYGYVRPDKRELKIREYEAFRSAYCGLCHSLRRRCGLAARFVVNYDLTFLSILLSESGGSIERRRCVASPFRRRACLSCDPALDEAADYSVILSRWKLRDTVADEGFFRGLPARLALLFLEGPYRRASRRTPAFDRQVRESLEALSELENSFCPSLDRTAECFASILQSAAQRVGDAARRRILSQLFYHIGRTVYILDAVDDLEEDLRKGRYNPLLYRFPSADGKLTDGDKEELYVTLRHSHNMIASAFELLEPGPWTSILENIIYLGIPQVTQLVMTGIWKKRRKFSRAQIGVYK